MALFVKQVTPPEARFASPARSFYHIELTLAETAEIHAGRPVSVRVILPISQPDATIVIVPKGHAAVTPVATPINNQQEVEER